MGENTLRGHGHNESALKRQLKRKEDEGMMTLGKTVKSSKESEIFLYSPADHVAHHSFLDRRPKISGSDTKDCITHCAVSNVNISRFASVPLAVKSNRGDMMRPNDTCTHSWLLYRRGIQGLKPRTLFDQAANIAASRK